MIGCRSTTVTAFIIASLGGNSKAPDLLLDDIRIDNGALSAREVFRESASGFQGAPSLPQAIPDPPQFPAT